MSGMVVSAAGIRGVHFTRCRPRRNPPPPCINKSASNRKAPPSSREGLGGVDRLQRVCQRPLGDHVFRDFVFEAPQPAALPVLALRASHVEVHQRHHGARLGQAIGREVPRIYVHERNMPLLWTFASPLLFCGLCEACGLGGTERLLRNRFLTSFKMPLICQTKGPL